MRNFVVIIEQAEGNLSAYVPDLPGCVATGATEDEVLHNIKEAIEFHLEGLALAGMPVPSSRAVVREVEVAA